MALPYLDFGFLASRSRPVKELTLLFSATHFAILCMNPYQEGLAHLPFIFSTHTAESFSQLKLLKLRHPSFHEKLGKLINYLYSFARTVF